MKVAQPFTLPCLAFCDGDNEVAETMYRIPATVLMAREERRKLSTGEDCRLNPFTSYLIQARNLQPAQDQNAGDLLKPQSQQSLIVR
jgi:hypothetical protein